MLRRSRRVATELSPSREVTVACWEVSISAPSGRLSAVSTREDGSYL